VPEGRRAEGLPEEDGGHEERRVHAEIPAASGTAAGAAKPSATRATFTPETLSTAEKALASYVGPLARILIKDAANKSGNLKELYSQLAAHIDSEEERRAFLASFK
jgi:serine/threonine-protein kinase